MYTPDAISSLEQRISWKQSQESTFPVQLDSFNLTGTSGKHFRSFHQLVSVDNIYATADQENMSEEKFNELLSDIRRQAVLDALTDILDNNPDYDEASDYSDVIITQGAIFDNAVGFAVVKSCLEMFLTTKRKNATELNMKLAAANIKLELDGFMNDNGHTVSKGVRYSYNRAVKIADEKLFPTDPIVKSAQVW